MTGKFIVIEGVDASGKTLQFNLLYERLKEKYKKILIADFPRYTESVWGKIIGEYLTGKYGKFQEISPFIAVMPYMADEYTWSRDLGIPFYEQGGIILSNRYFTSNVHQVAKLTGRSKEKFRDWLWPAGYDELGILKPDLVLFLDVNPSISIQLNGKKGKRTYLKGRKRDEAEKDREHQKASYREYIHTVKKEDYWERIRCVSRGEIDSPQEIHKRVWNAVDQFLIQDKPS